MILFSELHDASSKPWIQLSSFTTLVFLLLTQNCSGLPQVVGPSQPVLATVGDDVILSCQLEPAVDASGMSIEWSRSDLDPSYVYVWWDKEELESSKHPDYEGRTSLLFNKLKFGNVSLKLSKVKLSDEGKYKCFIPTLGEGSTVELVVGIDPFTVISLAGLDRISSSVELQCESAGWYPEPEVLWLDADGNLLSAGPTETVRGSDDLYTVSSRVTVEKKHGNKFTCRVQQKNITQSREALIQVTEDFFEVQSSKNSTIVGLAVSFTVAFIMLILAVLFVHPRQKRKRKTFERTVQQLRGNNSETENQLQQEKLNNETLKNQLEELKRNRSETENQLQEEKQKNEILNSRLEELEGNNSETNNQLQQEKKKNENLEYKLEEYHDEKNKFLNTKKTLQDEKLKLMKTERKLKTIIQNKFQELDEMNFDTNSDPTGSDEKNQQEELEKLQDENQKLMKTFGNLKTELQKMNQELKLAGPITVDEVNERDRYIRLKNISSEEIKLGGWKLELQKNSSKPDTYTFKESLKLKAGEILTMRRSKLQSIKHSDVDLECLELKNWNPKDKLQMNLISNNGENFKLL